MRRAGTAPETRSPAVVPLQTGQTTCHDAGGQEIPCAGSGQDGELRKGASLSLDAPRFERGHGTALDRLTGLIWTIDANPAEYPLTWLEALEHIKERNRIRALGRADWRMPNRRELRSLMDHQTRKPALPADHPFRNVFSGWYWTSTTAAINTAYAWYIHMEGARMFYGSKKQFFLLWPVCGAGSGALPATGQVQCFDADGNVISCAGTGQDGEFRFGRPWPRTRFELSGGAVIDRLTGLAWRKVADVADAPVTWAAAIDAVARMNRNGSDGFSWRMPNINELESLVDCSRHSPALPDGHPFEKVREGYWSSTTSMFEPDWAWALYLTKGAVGVGQKKGAHFSVWAVADLAESDGW